MFMQVTEDNSMATNVIARFDADVNPPLFGS